VLNDLAEAMKALDGKKKKAKANKTQTKDSTGGDQLVSS